MRLGLAFVLFAAVSSAQMFPPASGGGGSTTVGGDLSGTIGNATVSKIQGATPAAVATSGDYNSLVNLPAPASQTQGYSPNQTLAGCGVEFVSGLTFNIGACSYTIAGKTYATALTSRTLTTADPTNPRIDVIGVGLDSSGLATVFVTAGTAAISPVQPTIDPSTQLQLTFINVSAAASTPQNVTTDNLYDEGTEWTASSSAHISVTSTSNPYRNLKDIEGTAAVLGNNFTLVKPSSGTVDLATRNTLVFYLRSKAVWPTGVSGSTAARYLTLFWRSGSMQKGNQVIVRDGQFGFASSNTTSYQQLSIPTSLFGINGIPVTTLVGQVSGPSGSSSIGFYIDAITLQGGQTGPALPSTVVNYRGLYSSTTAYNLNDLVVSSFGVTYTALTASTGTALSNTATWQALSPIGVPFVSSYVGNPAAGALVYIYTTTDPFSFPANFLGSSVSCGTNPGATATYSILKNGSSIGTAAVSTSCGLTGSTSGGTSVSFAVNDRLTITAPNPQDSTAANVGITLRALRQ